MSIQQNLLKFFVLFSSIHIAYCIKSIELFNKNSQQNFKQSNWKVGQQLPTLTKNLFQFGISMWFKTKYNENNQGIYSLIDISTDLEKSIFGMGVQIDNKDSLLLPNASKEQSNLKLKCRNDEWSLLVITYQQDLFINIFIVMNDQDSIEKIKYKPSISFLIEDLIISITQQHQIIEYSQLFIYYDFSNNHKELPQSYIINIAIQKNDCKRIQDNKKIVFDNIRHKCIATKEQFNSYYQDIQSQNKTIHIISFNLAEYNHLQNDRNIIFQLNNQFNFLITEINKKYHLLFELNDEQHYIGQTDDNQSQITIQIEFNKFQENQYLIQYYQNQNFQKEILIKKITPLKDNQYQYLKQTKQFQKLQILNIIFLINFRISQSQHEKNNCLLKAIPIDENIQDSQICIYNLFKNENTNILDLNISRKHQQRNLATDPYIHGSNMRSIVRNSYSSSQFKSTITSAQSITTVLVVGYFKLSQTISGTQYLPVITVGVLSDFYNIFNVYMKTNTLIELKYVKDTDNTISFASNSVVDMTNKWFGIGLLYSKTSSSLKLVITDQSTYKFYGPSQINSVTIPSTAQTLDVCITCYIDGGVFGHFNGLVSSVKIVYDVSFSSINSYLFFNEYTQISVFKTLILSGFYNINIYTPNSEYDLGQGFSCNLGYAFYEGVCIDKNNCKTIIQDSNIYSSYEVGKFYDSTSNKCLNCSSNCVECTSASVCTTCRQSYLINNGSCIRCDNINSCSQLCPGQIFDPMNQMCVTTFNTSLQSLSNLLVSSRIITDNSDVIVQNSPSFSSINDQIVHCYIDVDNNPMTLYSFLGGVKFTTSTLIKKSFNTVPKGYKKSISLYVLFYGSGSPSDLQVKINTNIASLDSQQTIVLNKKSCTGSGSLTQSIFQVKFVIDDYKNNFDLVIQSNSANWGIRNLQVEISKCHPSCDSCKQGGGVDDCTTCNSSQTINKFQCNCAFGYYAKYSNCFDSPCVTCSSCSVSNCQKCEDITGYCTQCASGYSIKDGICILNSSCNTNDSPQLGFCGVSQDTGFTHFKQDRIVQYADYWKFYNNNVQAFTCITTRKCTPVITFSQQHTLQITLSNYFSYHFYQTIVIEFFLYQSIDKEDFTNLYESGTPIYSHCYHDQKMAFPNEPYNDAIFKETISYPKSNNQLYLQFEAKCDEALSNEGQSFSQIDLLYVRCHPMCKTCNGSTQANCINCIDNASVSGNCQCNSGYYFSLIRFPSTNSLPGSCLKCNSACKTCTGPSYTQCTTCSDGYTSDGNVCKYNCPDGKFWNQATLQCLSCHACCRTCVGNQNTQCHDCLSGYTLRNDQSCLFYNAQCQSCTVAINSLCGGTQVAHDNCLNSGWIVYDANTCVQCGKFVNNKCGGDSSQLIIDFCQVKGYQFNYDSNNCSSCIHVASGDTLTTGKCGRIEIQNSCSNYGWKLYDDNKCIDCNSNSLTVSNCVCDNSCSTCSRYQNPLYCLTCQPNLYLFNDNQCLPKCPNGYIIDGLKCIKCTDKQMPTCVNCYRTCLICNPFIESVIPNTCTACSTTRKLVSNTCECQDPEDTRESFQECSYQNIAVLNAILSNSSPLLTIFFGKQLVIPNTFQADVYSSSLCDYLFTINTKQLFGSSPECQISGQYISVKLGKIVQNNLIDEDSEIFDGELIYFEKNKLSFYKSNGILIDTYYNNIVIQNKITGLIKVTFDYVSIENSCNDISIQFKNIVNDAKRGFKQFQWSLQSYVPTNPTLQTKIENILQQANNVNSLNLLITKGLVKPDTQVKIRLDYTIKANEIGYEEFNLSVHLEKKLFLDAQSTVTNPFFRFQSAIIVFTSIIKICDPDGDYEVNEPLNISISSDEYPDKNYQNSNYLKQNYQIELEPYTIQTGKITYQSFEIIGGNN